MPWNPTGTASCAPSRKLNRNTSAGGKAMRGYSPRRSVPGSSRWLQTFHACGKVQKPRPGTQAHGPVIVEDVTLLRDQQITLHVRFKSGVAKTLHLPLAPNAWQKRMTRAPVLEEMRTLIGEHTDRETAALLNARGLSSGTGKPFTPWIVAKLRRKFGLKSIYLRLGRRGCSLVRRWRSCWASPHVT